MGFETLATVPDDGAEPVWTMVGKGNVMFMFQTFSSLGDELPDINRNNGASMLLYIKVKNIRTFFDEIKNSVPVLKGLETTFYGATEFTIKDINNYLLTFAEDE